jgi:hypothetical protein
MQSAFCRRSDEKASASFKYGPIAFWKMLFRLVNDPILCLNLGFEISNIGRNAIQRRSAHAPRAIFALEGPNRNVWIYVAHELSMRPPEHYAPSRPCVASRESCSTCPALLTRSTNPSAQNSLQRCGFLVTLLSDFDFAGANRLTMVGFRGEAVHVIS